MESVGGAEEVEVEIPAINILSKGSPTYSTSPGESIGGWGSLRGKGRWTDDEDAELSQFVRKYGAGSWKNVAKRTSLNRDAQSCRLRWASYLDPNVNKAAFTPEEDALLLSLVKWDGDTKWVKIAADQFPTRTGYQLQGRWHLLMNKRRRTLGQWWAKGTEGLSPDTSPPCPPQPYATPRPPPLSVRQPTPIFNGGSSQCSPLTPDTAPTLSFLPPLPTSTRTSGSGSSSAATSPSLAMPPIYQNGGEWVWKQDVNTRRFGKKNEVGEGVFRWGEAGEEGSVLMRSSGLGEGLEDEWGSVLKLPTTPYQETIQSSPHVRPGWSGWGGSGKREQDGKGIGEGPPQSLCLVFHGSGTEGWTLRSSRESLKRKCDVDLDLDLSLRISPPGQGDWSGQLISGQGKAQKAGGVGACLDLRLDLPEPGDCGTGIRVVEELSPMAKRQMGLGIPARKGGSSSWLASRAAEMCRIDGRGQWI